MKLRQRENEITQNFEPTESYDMELAKEHTALIIERLIDIYKDPISAIIREYSSNARDAHIEAGKADVPIEVITPKYGNGHLKIKDYGVGLDSEGLQTYVSLGKSTKRDKNDQVGAFGLGCKSALSYASQFVVIAVKNGTKRFASVGRNRDDKFTIEVFKTIETDEPNGVEIKIPIREEHRADTVRKAEQFFSFWDKGTVLLNGEEPKNFVDNVSNPETNLLPTEFGTLYIGNDYGNSVYVRMGNVAYPVEPEYLLNGSGGTESRFNWYSLLPTYGFNSSVSLVLEAQIGALELVPSRDALKYSNYTLNTLHALIKAVRNEAVAQLNESIREAGSYTEAEEKILTAQKLLDDTDLKEKKGAIDWATGYLDTTYNGVEYSRSLKGVINDNVSEQTIEKAEKKYSEADAKLRKLQDSNDYTSDKHAELVAKVRKYRDEHFDLIAQREKTYKATSADIRSTVHARMGHNPNSLRSRAYDTRIEYFDDNKGKATIVWFGPEDGVDHENIADFKLTSYKQKLGVYLREKGLKKLYLVAGVLEDNPWVFKNDKITVVKGTDFDNEVREIRQRLRKEGQGSTPAVHRTETEYDALVYEEDSNNSPYHSPNRVTEVKVSELKDSGYAKIVYYHNKDLPTRQLAELAHYDDAIILAVNKGRSVNKLKERAENNGLEIIRLKEWTNERLDEIKNNSKVYEHLKSKVEVRNLQNMGHFAKFVSSYQDLLKLTDKNKSGYYYSDTRMTNLTDPEETLQKLSELVVSGESVKEWAELDNKASSVTDNLDGFSDREKALFTLYESLVTFAGKKIEFDDIKMSPTREQIYKDYPMLKASSSYFYGDTISIFIDYINLVNNANKESKQ